MKKFISLLGVVPSVENVIALHCDNQGVITQSEETTSHFKSKHFHQMFYIICEIVRRKDVNICKVRTDNNIVDSMTKPLSQSKHESHISLWGLSI